MNELVKLIQKDIKKIQSSNPEDGSVIRFDMFVEAGPVDGYRFVAIFAKNRWYLSGTIDYMRNLRIVEHDRLMELFARQPDKYRNIAVPTGWVNI